MHRIVFVVTFSSILPTFAHADIAEDPNARTSWVSMTCQTTYGSGAWIGMRPIIMVAAPKQTRLTMATVKRDTANAGQGGSWGLYPTHCRSANRGGGTPAGRFYSYGFRVVRARSLDWASKLKSQDEVCPDVNLFDKQTHMR